MLYQLAKRMWKLLPRLLDVITSFQGGLLGELLLLIIIAKFLPPIIDVVFKLWDWTLSIMRRFDK